MNHSIIETRNVNCARALANSLDRMIQQNKFYNQPNEWMVSAWATVGRYPDGDQEERASVELHVRYPRNIRHENEYRQELLAKLMPTIKAYGGNVLY